MASKPKFRRDSVSAVAPERTIEGVLAKGMYVDATHQAKKLVYDSPTPEHWALLRKVYLAHVQHLCDRDKFITAHPLLLEMENFPQNDAKWWEQLAVLRAKLGDTSAALQLLARVPDVDAPKRIMGVVVDRALKLGPPGRAGLSADLHAGFDLIIQAFQHYEQKRDEEARQSLQGIGTQSPFLDWKLMLRGLIAYSANDDARALENWQRLDAQRLPAQLIAGMRFGMDPAYRAALPKNLADQLQQQNELSFSGVLPSLRKMQKLMATEQGLPQALGLAQDVVPELKRTHPHLVGKLANCFYWSIYGGGRPEDLKGYRRAFGPPADDPDFARLEAMVMDRLEEYRDANKFWQAYEKWIANHPQRWPDKQSDRARATLWLHMGQNALEHLEMPEEDDEFLLDFLPFGRKTALRKPVPLKPTAQECFARACELAPEWEKPAATLFNHLVETDQLDEAEKLASQLLEKFPNHIEVLASIAMLHAKRGNPGMARDCFKKALQSNPLDRDLRIGASVMAHRHGRELAIAGEQEQARAAWQEALDLDPGVSGAAIRCLWAAGEFKWKHLDRARQLLQEAQSDPSLRLVIAYRVIVEGGRLKVPKPILAPYQKQLDDGLAGSPPAAEVFPLAAAVEAYRTEAVPYRGLATHQKKIEALFQKLINNKPAELELEKFGIALLRLKSWRFLKMCAEQGKRRFPNNAYFHYFLGEYELRKKNFREQSVATHFKKAVKLMEGSTDEKYRSLRETIDRLLKEFPSIQLFMNDFGWGFNFNF